MQVWALETKSEKQQRAQLITDAHAYQLLEHWKGSTVSFDSDQTYN
jgi:hypothetical protein